MKRVAKQCFLAGFFGGLLLAGIFADNTLAAEPSTVESITLSPVNKRYSLDAGTTKSDEFKIVNDGKVAYTFKVYAQPYFVKGENYDPDYFSKSPMSDANKWVSFEQQQYRIEPGQTLVVPYTFAVSKDAAPGGHYGVIFAETQASGKPDATSVARQKRVGMILYATVNGDFRLGGEVSEQSVPFFQFTAPLVMHTTVKNTGNADFLVKMHTEISDVFGNKKFSVDKEYPVLPDTSRKMVVEWKQAPTFGFYKVVTTSDFLTMSKTSSQYVLMAPIWAYLVLAIVVMAAILYFARMR